MDGKKYDISNSELFSKLPLRIRQNFPRGCDFLDAPLGFPREGDARCKMNGGETCIFNSPRDARKYSCYKLKISSGNGELTRYELDTLISLEYFRYPK